MSDHPATSRTAQRVLIVAAGAVLLALPIYLEAFWLQLGVLAMAFMVAAIGLNLLVGTTGQLSLAHAFFIAVGAYGYAFLGGDTDDVGGGVVAHGLGLPAPLAATLAVVIAGFAGLLFAPIAGRLRGVYLGLASLSLVFVGQHLLFNVAPVTGGFNGRPVPELDLFGFSLSGDQPSMVVFGVPFGAPERLWYVALVLTLAVAVLVANITRSRHGRALRMVRDNEIAAGCMGIPVGTYKAAAFVLSSMLAGAAGIMLALVFRRIVPDYFGLLLSVDLLAMIVIGGLGSLGGAALGAAFVTALPLVLSRYSAHLPLLAEPGAGGVDPAVAARLIFGAAVVGIILFEPGGISASVRRIARTGRGRRVRDLPQQSDLGAPEAAPQERTATHA